MLVVARELHLSSGHHVHLHLHVWIHYSIHILVLICELTHLVIHHRHHFVAVSDIFVAVCEGAGVSISALSVLLEILALDCFVFLVIVSTWLIHQSHFSWRLLIWALLLAHDTTHHSASIGVSSHSKSTSASHFVWHHSILLLVWPGLLHFSEAHLGVAILPLLRFERIFLLFWIHRILWLSELFVSMSEVTLVAKRTMLVSLIVPASLCFVFIVDFCLLGKRLFR